VRIIRRVDGAVLTALILGAALESSSAAGSNNADVASERAGEVAISPLCDAALRGDLPTVRALLRKGVPVDERFQGETALMRALEPFVGMPPATMGPPSGRARRAGLKQKADKFKIAKLLLVAGADVRLTTQEGATPLHLAALADGPEGLLIPIVRDLIRRGAPVDARTSEGGTPLQFAVWNQRLELAKMLVSAGANLDTRGAHGKSPAEELVTHGNQHALDELRALASKRP